MKRWRYKYKMDGTLEVVKFTSHNLHRYYINLLEYIII